MKDPTRQTHQTHRTPDIAVSNLTCSPPAERMRRKSDRSKSEEQFVIFAGMLAALVGLIPTVQPSLAWLAKQAAISHSYPRTGLAALPEHFVERPFVTVSPR